MPDATSSRPVRSSHLVAIARNPIHAALVPFPHVSFTLALLTDIAYWQTANVMWQNFSAWLLFAGLVLGAVAAIVALIELLLRPVLRSLGLAWLHFVALLVVLALAFVNSLVHAGDGWTAVVPWGLALSVVTVLVILLTAWLGRATVYRHPVEVSTYA